MQFRVIGPDTRQVRDIAARVHDLVRQCPRVRHTQPEGNEQVRKPRLQVDQDRARLLGLSSAEVAKRVQVALSGAPAARLRLFLRNGQSVLLPQLARLETGWKEPVLDALPPGLPQPGSACAGSRPSVTRRRRRPRRAGRPSAAR